MAVAVVLHAIVFSLLGLPGSIVNLSEPGHYLHWHFIEISYANLIVIGLMLFVFVLAIVVPFPSHGTKGRDDG